MQLCIMAAACLIVRRNLCQLAKTSCEEGVSACGAYQTYNGKLWRRNVMRRRISMAAAAHINLTENRWRHRGVTGGVAAWRKCADSAAENIGMRGVMGIWRKTAI
jgi:hypothetical protein